jgi:tetratricopeptide (TPR) repeat protein
MVTPARRPGASEAFLYLLLLSCLVGCSGVPAPPETTLPVPPMTADAPLPEVPPAAPEYGNFETETLYELLVAELSLRRGDFEPALDRYAAQALGTRDPGVVAKAARLAAVTGDDERALELSQLWVQVAPEDADALHAAAVALLEAGEFDAALGHLRALRRLGGRTDFRVLGEQIDRIGPDARDEVIRALAALQESWPDDAQLSWARAALLEKAGRAYEALTVLDGARAARAGTDALLLRARLLEATGDAPGAVTLLRTSLEEGDDSGRPGPGRLRYRLARLLIETGDLEGARIQFERLQTLVGDNAEVLLSLGLITMELDRLTESRGWLERLLRTGRRPDTANYFLGLVSEQAGDTAAALEAWSRVEPGFEFSRAQGASAALLLTTAGPADLRNHLDGLRTRYPGEAVMLWLLEGQALIDAERPDASVTALGEALRVFPDQPELLYARAMAHDANGYLEGLESDLARLLELDPEDAMALNALGYTLADRTPRLDEARALVERALALDPDEPAFVDSMGWVEFRSGNHARAIELLEQAFAEFPNHEVAAHLGEALWSIGERERALGVWRRGLSLEQGTEVLRDTLERLLSEEERSALEAPPEEDAAGPAAPPGLLQT